MFQKIKRIVGTSVLIIFIAALVFVLISRASGTTPSLFGYSVLRIKTGSMEPDLKVGSIILVKKVDPATLQKGDVITYYSQDASIKGNLVTHQIYQEPRIEDGKYHFITKGLRNTLPDTEFDESQVFGKVLYRIPFLGTFYDFFSKWYGFAAFAAVMIIAFSAELINLISIIRNKDQDDDPEVPATAAEPVFNQDFDISVEMESNQIITELDDDIL